MADSSSLYGTTTPTGTVSSSNYTTLYSGGNNFVPSGDNVIISGTLTVNGCAILTDCNTFTLLPYNATTVNAFGSATAVSIGGATGVTTIQNQLSTGNYLFPLADGTADQILATDGSGVLYWADVQSLDTNYTIQADSTTGGANLTLVGSDLTTDSVKFANGTGVSIVRTDANTITTSIGQDVATTSTPTFAGANLGNITIGVATDNTITTTTGNLILDSATNLVQVSGDFNVDSGVLFVNSTTNRVGINNNNPEFELHIDQGLDGLTQLGMSSIERTALFTLNDSDDLFSLSYGFPAGSSNRLQFSPTDQWFNTGKLGVATATPAYTLDVNGQGYFNQGVVIDGVFQINGSSSGYSQFIAPATGSNLAYALPSSQGAANTVLTNDGVGNLSWALPGGGGSTFGNISIGVVTDNTIASTNTNGDIILQPNGDGDVNITADTLFIGDGGSSAVITTNGTGNIYLSTNNGTNTGTIFLEQGVDGNIVLGPYSTGTGQVKTYNDFIVEEGIFFVSKADKKVGINTTNPGQELTISDGGDGYVQLGMENTERLWLVTNNAGDDLISYSIVPTGGSPINRLQFDSASTDQWFPTGQLGIGTTSPAYELDVSGTGRFTANLIVDGGNITTTATTANIFDNTATTINIGTSSATEIFLGGSASTTNVAKLDIDNVSTLDTATITTTSTATATLYSTTRNAMTGLVNIKQGANVHCVNFTVLRVDATTALLTTYAEMYNNISLANLTADVSGGGMRLRVTPTSATSTIFYGVRTSLD